jgi:hypothetical protein
MLDIIFKVGLQSAYDALKAAGSTDNGTLYFTSDTKKIYKGATLYTGSVEQVDELPATGEAGVLYVVNSTAAASIWTGSAYVALNATANGTAHDVTYVADTRTITIPMVGKEDLVINLGKDLVVTKGEYAEASGEEPARIILTLTNDDTVVIPVTDLIDVYTGGTTTTTTVSTEGNEVAVTVKVSEAENNSLTVKEDGLFVDLSSKINKIADAAGSKVVVSTATGEVAESAVSVGGETLAESGNATVLATEAAVKTAVDAKASKVDAETANGTIIVAGTSGDIAATTTTIGGATLAEDPQSTVVATEAAVSTALNAALTWGTF